MGGCQACTPAEAVQVEAGGGGGEEWPQAADAQQVGEGHSVTTVESPLVAQHGTPFGQFLAKGHMAVVRAKYFDQCLCSGVPFQDRSNIPLEAFIEGEEVVDLWEEFGYAFLVIISYPWLSKEHPDPHCYHLPRLVRALKAFRAYHEEESWQQKGGLKADRVRELGGGVILDYCSFTQGKRTDEEDRIFKEGLKLINIPYGHRDVTALKLTSTPATEARRYEDRGWTHFESTVIDGKAPSGRHTWGERNVLTCDDAFAPKGGTDAKVLKNLSKAQRKPPLTPKRFRDELEVRRLRAEAKNARLFTNGKDSPIILERYDASFDELSRSKKLDYTGMSWGAAEAKELALALPFFGVLEELALTKNLLDSEAAAALATALPQCRALRSLELQTNRLGNGAQASAALAAALGSCPALEDVRLFENNLGPEVATALATALPLCGVLRTINFGSNRLGEVAEAAAAMVAALGSCPTLEEVWLHDNRLGAEAAAALATALPQCSRLHTLRLGSNLLGDAVEASAAFAAALGSCPSLQGVFLRNNNLGPEAAAALAKALPKCRTLRHLDLRDNCLDDQGEVALRDAWREAGKEDINLDV